MEFNYITLGEDCSTAATLNSLGLRKQSLPFDWLVSDMDNIIQCINDEFLFFHKNLYLNTNKTRVIDYYNFEYPHDYPNHELFDINQIGTGGFNEKKINDGWEDYIELNLEKYKRRSDRFLDILNDRKDLIILYRGSINNVFKFKSFLEFKFKKNNAKFLVATNEVSIYDDIITCNPECDGVWNDINIWKIGLEKIISNI